jgi:class 3 adenylate cyclase
VRWMRILSEVISPQAEKFHGTVVKSTGDGVLVEFPSAYDAGRLGSAIAAAGSWCESKTRAPTPRCYLLAAAI